MAKLFDLDSDRGAFVLRLGGDDPDETNKLTRARVVALADCIERLACEWPSRTPQATGLILTGNPRFFSAGADLAEITALSGPEAYRFAAMGQRLMHAAANFPAPTVAAVHGYCMGGGLDLALACGHRIAGPHAIFGHRGAALGLITGWGGTQRLPRLVGKARALEMFVAAEKANAHRALEIGLVEAIAADPLANAVQRIHDLRSADF